MKSSRVKSVKGARTDFPSPRTTEDTVLFAIRSRECTVSAVTSPSHHNYTGNDRKEHDVTTKEWRRKRD